MAVRPSWAAAAFDDMSKPVSSFPSLFGTRESFVGSTVKKLPRDRAAIKPL
tara:strand:+ start:398 stop:550 length:153 start_codon:yes stop_codon:yes gene_type:complete